MSLITSGSIPGAAQPCRLSFQRREHLFSSWKWRRLLQPVHFFDGSRRVSDTWVATTLNAVLMKRPAGVCQWRLLGLKSGRVKSLFPFIASVRMRAKRDHFLWKILLFSSSTLSAKGSWTQRSWWSGCSCGIIGLSENGILRLFCFVQGLHYGTLPKYILNYSKCIT